MEIEIKDKKENALLDRIEVRFSVSHTNATTPKRDAVRDELAKLLNAKKDCVIVESMDSEYGRAQTNGTANIYRAVEQIKALEPTHLQKRHGMAVEEKKKVEAPKKAAAGGARKGGH